jgi:RHS repeat-associated protein
LGVDGRVDPWSPGGLTDDRREVLERHRYNAGACPEQSRGGACTVLDARACPERSRAASRRSSDDSDNASDVENPFLFTGRRLDSEWGGMQYRNRSYSTVLGRFVSRDPLEYAGSYSLYDYVVSSPTVVGDPMGLVHITSEEDLGDGRVRMEGEWYWYAETAYPIPKEGVFSGWTYAEVKGADCLCRRSCSWAILEDGTSGWRVLEGGFESELRNVEIDLETSVNVHKSEMPLCASLKIVGRIFGAAASLQLFGKLNTMAKHYFVTEARWSVAEGLEVEEWDKRTRDWWWLRPAGGRYVWEVSLYDERPTGGRVPDPLEEQGWPRQTIGGAARSVTRRGRRLDVRLSHDAPPVVMAECAKACRKLNKDGDE